MITEPFITFLLNISFYENLELNALVAFSAEIVRQIHYAIINAISLNMIFRVPLFS